VSGRQPGPDDLSHRCAGHNCRERVEGCDLCIDCQSRYDVLSAAEIPDLSAADVYWIDATIETLIAVRRAA
jgi:hypothetical protein